MGELAQMHLNDGTAGAVEAPASEPPTSVIQRIERDYAEAEPLGSDCSSCSGRAIVDPEGRLVLCTDCLERALSSSDICEEGTGG